MVLPFCLKEHVFLFVSVDFLICKPQTCALSFTKPNFAVQSAANSQRYQFTFLQTAFADISLKKHLWEYP